MNRRFNRRQKKHAIVGRIQANRNRRPDDDRGSEEVDTPHNDDADKTEEPTTIMSGLIDQAK